MPDSPINPTMKRKPASPPPSEGHHPHLWVNVGNFQHFNLREQFSLVVCGHADVPNRYATEYLSLQEHEHLIEEAERQARGECEAEIADLANKLHDANRALVKEEELNREFGESLDFTTECIRDRDAQLAALTEERDRMKGLLQQTLPGLRETKRDISLVRDIEKALAPTAEKQEGT